MNYHNKHYTEIKIEPWEIMRNNFTLEEWRGFLKGNCQKYLSRIGHKNQDSADVDKLVVYALELQKTYTGGTND